MPTLKENFPVSFSIVINCNHSFHVLYHEVWSRSFRKQCVGKQNYKIRKTCHRRHNTQIYKKF